MRPQPMLEHPVRDQIPLLDTHVWVWSHTEPQRLTKRATTRELQVRRELRASRTL